jgi:hypothetical protein
MARGVRIWVGVFDEKVVADLTWTVNETVLSPAEVITVRGLGPVAPGPPAVVTQTGVFDLAVDATDRIEHRIRVTAHWPDGRTAESDVLRTRRLPDRVPDALSATFNVLLVSCFYGRHDAFGQAGALVANRLAGGPYQPDLVLTVGDQVYLDNPPDEALHLAVDGFAGAFERQYRANWQGLGYAQILRSGPVAAIPDDHEYWNNYPQPGAIWPASWFEGTGRKAWEDSARAMYDGFQLAEPDVYCYDFDVRPLSFFMMDNRTFRVRAGFGDRVPSLREDDLQRLKAWVDRVLIDKELLPVLCTGPSLLQPAAGWFKGAFFDRNFANYSDYPDVMEGVLRLSAAGHTPLLLTGDVHYPRVTKATYSAGDHAWSDLFEVISSPASLVAGPYAESKPANERFRLEGLDASLRCDHLWPTADRADTRDHVALLRFRSTATGVTVEPTYWMINGPARGRTPLIAPTLTLQRFPATVPQP